MTLRPTEVTQPNRSTDTPRVGQVVAERYELIELIDDLGPTFAFRALDQENERPVLVRFLGGSVPTREVAELVVGRLRGLRGVGGRYISSLLDADWETGRPFTVEAWPHGTQLSTIFESRFRKAQTLAPGELVPVVAQLAAALDAIVSPWHHGDIRAEQVWVDSDGLRLTGAYLLAALPTEVLAARVAECPDAAAMYPPELLDGHSSAEADRWAIGQIAQVALGGPTRAGIPTEIRTALDALLTEAAAQRTPSLEGLLSSLSIVSGVPIPRVDPEPTVPAHLNLEEPPERPTQKFRRPRSRRIAGASADGTQELELGDIEPLPADRPPSAPPPPDEGLLGVPGASAASPRLQAERPEPTTTPHRVQLPPTPPSDEDSDEHWDPRLVRAALGVTLESSTGKHIAANPSTSNPSASEPLDDNAPIPKPPAPQTTQAHQARPQRALVPKPKVPAPVSAVPPSAPRHPASPRVEGSKTKVKAAAQIPRPKTPSRPPPPPRTPVGVSEATPTLEQDRPEAATLEHERPSAAAIQRAVESRVPTPEPSPTPKTSPMSPAPAPPAHPTAPASPTALATAPPSPAGETAVLPRPVAPATERVVTTAHGLRSPRPRGRLAGAAIVFLSLIVAAVIVSVGYVIAEHRRSEARSRQIQERLEQLRGGEP